jgi:hypothetical protein
MVYIDMHIPIKKGKNVSMKGKGLLLSHIKVKPLPLEITGGDILAKNRIVGITSNAVRSPPSNTMASIGGAIDFSKHVKRSNQGIQKLKEKDERIKFVF